MMKQHSKKTRTAFTTVVQILFFLMLPAVLHAGEVTLAWDPNSEGNLAGYKLYYDSDSDVEMYGGSGANEGDSPVVIYLEDLADADSPTFTLTGLTTGEYYYFALTAFDTDGMESDFSDEVGTLVGAASSLAKTAGDESSEGSGGSGSGCFITGAMGSSTENMPTAAAAVLLLMAAAAAMQLGPIKIIVRVCLRKRLR